VSKRTILMFSSGLILIILIGLTLAERAGLLRASPKIHDITLASGDHFEGLIFPVRSSQYLLQTESQCLLLGPADISAIDGTQLPESPIPTAGGNPWIQETFEEISADGSVLVRSSKNHINTTDQVIVSRKWGIAPHEAKLFEDYKIIDQYGNELTYQLSNRSSGGQLLQVVLARPILPGEVERLTTIFKNDDSVFQSDSTWVYRNAGRYPDNRLATRAVSLPAGATVISVDPEPLFQGRIDNRWLIVWRRYFHRTEETIWEIRYQLETI